MLVNEDGFVYILRPADKRNYFGFVTPLKTFWLTGFGSSTVQGYVFRIALIGN